MFCEYSPFDFIEKFPLEAKQLQKQSREATEKPHLVTICLRFSAVQASFWRDVREFQARNAMACAMRVYLSAWV